jgi:ATP-dependent Lon protease
MFRTRAGDVATLPVLPSREVVAFPGQPLSLVVGRPRSLGAVHTSMASTGRRLLLVAQRDAEVASPQADDLHAVGVVARVDQLLHLPDGNLRILVEGISRARATRWIERSDHLAAEIEVPPVPASTEPDVATLCRTAKSTFERYCKLHRGVPPESAMAINAIDDPSSLADALVVPLPLRVPERQALLETFEPRARLEHVVRLLLAEIEALGVEKKLRSRARKEPPREECSEVTRRPDEAVGRSELDELAAAIAARGLPAEVRERAEREMRKLSQMNALSAEATVVRNWIDWIIAMPWGAPPPVDVDLDRAATILDEDHHGLDKIKDRILEHLAVGRLVERMRGPILCLVGPPGVGKTSLARSIARAASRPFVKVALGGVRDEAEIRGHRRTYIGALPGRILSAMKRADRTDPVFLLDEIDKMSSDFRGDPSSALLEVLDPEQNATFTDHYLDVDYDLSRVLFLTTANAAQNIPVPLLDRLEIIELSGYTEAEKVAIARRYLVPRQMAAHGLDAERFSISNEALVRVIRQFTRESGVRDLDRHVATLCRKVAHRVVAKGDQPASPVKIVTGNVERLLGPPRFAERPTETGPAIGLARGLAVTPWGGEVLDIEVAVVPGKGSLILTGRLGDWLKESATAASTYVRSRREALRIDTDLHEGVDVHVHYPGNALRTDGPSAGIAMATALVSALTGIPVRSDLAMTGEISLRGRVLPVGGVKEKLLAAHRRGVTTVLVPDENKGDLQDVPPRVRDALRVVLVGHMDRVLVEALDDSSGRSLLAEPMPEVPEGAVET